MTDLAKVTTVSRKIVKFPAAKVELPKNPRRRKTSDKGIRKRSTAVHSYSEYKQIVDYFKDKGDFERAAIFTVGCATGLRGGDVCQLKTTSVFDDDGNFRSEIDVKEQKTGKRSSNQTDVCLITPAIKEALMEFYRAKDIDYMSREYVFQSHKKNKSGEYSCVSLNAVNKVLKEAQAALGISHNIGTHSMRKTFVNTYLAVVPSINIDFGKLFMAQNFLKHSSAQTTFRYCESLQFSEQGRMAVSDFLLGKSEIDDISEGIKAANNDKIQDVLGKLEELEELLNKK